MKNLKRKENLGVIIAVAGLLLAMSVQQPWAERVGFAALFLGIIVTKAMLRCPHCGKTAGSRREKKCRHCGKQIDWN